MRQTFTKALLSFVLALFSIGSLIAQNNNQNAILPLLLKNATQMGVTYKDITDAVISSSYTDENTQTTYVYFQQAYQGVRLYNTMITASFKNNELVYSSGSFIRDLASKISSTTPLIDPMDATRSAAQHLNLTDLSGLTISSNQFLQSKMYKIAAANLAKKDIEVSLLLLPSKNKLSLSLVWNVDIEVKNSADEWNIRIDAKTGNFIEKTNATIYETLETRHRNNCNPSGNNKIQQFNRSFVSPQNHSIVNNLPPNVTTGNYHVIPFPIESPNYGSPATVTNPWLLAGATNNATTNGWHFDGTTNYTVTRGNNVYAFLDVQNNNTPNITKNWPDTSSTAAPTLNFVHPPNFNLHPSSTVNGNQNKKFALDNLFYWNNLMHDVFYQYGFNEVAGNYQANNLGRGGTQGDYVEANAQDGGGTSNANFNPGADGTKGRMQMYLFNINTPAKITVNTPSLIAGNYDAIEGSFSTANLLVNVGPVTAPVVYYNDVSGGLHEGCVTPSNVLTGKIALIDRGNCTFVNKVTAAKNAGAVGVIIVNYDDALLGMSGNANSITIPAVLVASSTGDILKAQLANNLNVTLNAPVLKDGDIDNGVVCHEYGHGISNRLTGGPATSSCLGNAEEGGEGWSDYIGLMMTTNWATATTADGALPRPIGTWVLNQAPNDVGIRRFPYSTDMTINPLTYNDMAASTEVHDIGEIWCATLWDLTWKLIQQYGITGNLYNAAGTGGNVIAMKLVMEGMKLQPCSPGYLDARDAILAADASLYNNAHKCAIWDVFARRGMGLSANQGSSLFADDQTASFDVPVCDNPVPVTLFSFEARPIGNEVVLDWKTLSEINTRDFTVEYSTNGISWNTLGSVTAKNRSSNNYSFIHTKPVMGNNFYRIKMNDADGSYKYSPVKNVKKGTSNTPALVLIPNPSKDLTTLYIEKYQQPATLNIYDAAGSLVKKINVKAGQQQAEINTAGMASGIYTIETILNNEKQFIRMMVKH